MSEDGNFGARVEHADLLILGFATGAIVDIDVVFCCRRLSGGRRRGSSGRRVRWDAHGSSARTIRYHAQFVATLLCLGGRALGRSDADIVAVETVPPHIAGDAGSVRQTVTLVRTHANGVTIEVVAPNLARGALRRCGANGLQRACEF